MPSLITVFDVYPAIKVAPRNGSRVFWGEAAPEDRLGLTPQDEDLQILPRETILVVGMPGEELIQPAAGVSMVRQAVMGHREERPVSRHAIASPGVNAILQSVYGLVEAARAIKRGAKRVEDDALLSRRVSCQSRFGHLNRNSKVGDGIGTIGAEPGDIIECANIINGSKHS
jgi:hypothetical protein